MFDLFTPMQHIFWHVSNSVTMLVLGYSSYIILLQLSSPKSTWEFMLRLGIIGVSVGATITSIMDIMTSNYITSWAYFFRFCAFFTAFVWIQITLGWPRHIREQSEEFSKYVRKILNFRKYICGRYVHAKRCWNARVDNVR